MNVTHHGTSADMDNPANKIGARIPEVVVHSKRNGVDSIKARKTLRESTEIHRTCVKVTSEVETPHGRPVTVISAGTGADSFIATGV